MRYIVLSFLTLLLQATPVPADTGAGAATAVAPLPAPEETFTVGTLHLRRYGDDGRPLILIPGLGSGAWVWRDTIAHFRDDHVIYAVTLAGFAGTPAPDRQAGLMDRADANLLKLLRQHHIEHPVLIGHSLGGTLAIRFASEHSKLLSAVIAVDGLPIFPGLEAMAPGQRTGYATRMKQRFMSATPEQFRVQQIRYMQTIGMLDREAAKAYGALQAESDADTVAQYLFEVLQTDLRAKLPNVSIPLLEIAPYNAADIRKAVEAGTRPEMSEAQKADYYRHLLQGAPQAQVLTISPSRHFVMLDRPERFRATVERFLERL